MPMEVYTFFSYYYFNGKVIIPYKDSGLRNSVNDIKKLVPNAEVKDGLVIHGSDTKNSKSKIISWLNK